MTGELYQEAILARSKQAIGDGSLESPDARVVVDNPVCGDRITLEIRVAGGTIAAVAHRVRGCVLCQAAASLIGANAPGSHRSDIDVASTAVAAMMAGTGGPPSGAWRDLAMFSPVADHKSRHQCVILPFEALRRALDAAGLTE